MVLHSEIKKKYASPTASIEYFTIDSAITTSGGQGEGDGGGEIILGNVAYAAAEIDPDLLDSLGDSDY